MPLSFKSRKYSFLKAKYKNNELQSLVLILRKFFYNIIQPIRRNSYVDISISKEYLKNLLNHLARDFKILWESIPSLSCGECDSIELLNQDVVNLIGDCYKLQVNDYSGLTHKNLDMLKQLIDELKKMMATYNLDIFHFDRIKFYLNKLERDILVPLKNNPNVSLKKSRSTLDNIFNELDKRVGFLSSEKIKSLNLDENGESLLGAIIKDYSENAKVLKSSLAGLSKAETKNIEILNQFLTRMETFYKALEVKNANSYSESLCEENTLYTFTDKKIQYENKTILSVFSGDPSVNYIILAILNKSPENITKELNIYNDSNYHRVSYYWNICKIWLEINKIDENTLKIVHKIKFIIDGYLIWCQLNQNKSDDFLINFMKATWEKEDICLTQSEKKLIFNIVIDNSIIDNKEVYQFIKDYNNFFVFFISIKDGSDLHEQFKGFIERFNKIFNKYCVPNDNLVKKLTDVNQDRDTLQQIMKDDAWLQISILYCNIIKIKNDDMVLFLDKDKSLERIYKNMNDNIRTLRNLYFEVSVFNEINPNDCAQNDDSLTISEQFINTIYCIFTTLNIEESLKYAVSSTKHLVIKSQNTFLLQTECKLNDSQVEKPYQPTSRFALHK